MHAAYAYRVYGILAYGYRYLLLRSQPADAPFIFQFVGELYVVTYLCLQSSRYGVPFFEFAHRRLNNILLTLYYFVFSVHYTTRFIFKNHIPIASIYFMIVSLLS